MMPQPPDTTPSGTTVSNTPPPPLPQPVPAGPPAPEPTPITPVPEPMPAPGPISDAQHQQIAYIAYLNYEWRKNVLGDTSNKEKEDWYQAVQIVEWLEATGQPVP